MRPLVLVLALVLAPLAQAADAHPESPETPVSVADDNPLLDPWTGPHGGVPPFAAIEADQFEPAIDAAMDELRDEVDAIASAKGKPTFDNTIAAFDDAGRAYGRVMAVYGVYRSTMSTPELREVEQRTAPKTAALWDEITQNEALFARIEAVHTSKKQQKKMTPEQQRLTWRIYTDFVRSGAQLDEQAKARLAAINQELATLYTTFRQNLLADEQTWVAIDDEAHLAGLPESLVASMAAAAEEQGVEGWIVMNTRSSVDPFLTYSDRRDLREKVWRAFVNRGDNGDAHDNNDLIRQILSLRAERAELLGYETHAHYRLEDAVAGSPAAAIELMEAVWTPAKAKFEAEVAAQQALADELGHDLTIEPWDYRYYQEKVRARDYDIDADELEPYLQLEKLREAMFWVAGELYDLHFQPIDDVPVVHPDVRVWEVVDGEGEHVGLWYFDPYARPGKRSGAWMNAYRSQETFRGERTPIVSNNSNFVKGTPGEPVLISWDDAETLFHEFGHALHGLLSDVTYPRLAGTSVPRDYVEFPSQLNERWLATPEVLSKFALHVETGEPIPTELVERLQEAKNHDQGFATVEYLSSALVDMKLHLAEPPIDPDAFEEQALEEIGMPDEIVMRHRLPQFAHLFSGDAYSASYYSYLWADTLTADAAEAFVEAGSMYDQETADRLREHVLSAGNTVDPAEAFEAFRGRPVQVDALMRDRGFPVPEGDGEAEGDAGE